MATHDILLIPRDPVLIRDGRPFTTDTGTAATSLPWPLPGTVAGAMRTLCGQYAHVDWRKDGPQRVIDGVEVAGPLLMLREHDTSSWVPCCPSPSDALWVDHHDQRAVIRLAPWDAIPVMSGCDLPFRLLPLMTAEKRKPSTSLAFWTVPDILSWLYGNVPAGIPKGTSFPPRETRTHVKVDPASFTSEDGMLYSVTSLVFNDYPRATLPAMAMLVRLSGSLVPEQLRSEIVPFGGERRVAYVNTGANWPSIPAKAESCLKTVRATGRLRLQLVTPALFSAGWRPGWLREHHGWLEGEIPGLPGVTVRLVSAGVGTRQAVSGWNMARTAEGQEQGPKAARYMAPAGSVYFFEIQSGSLQAEAWQRAWLTSCCDDRHDRRNGYGLMLLGTWNYAHTQFEVQ